jgi:release factor glutamine methyltransferase
LNFGGWIYCEPVTVLEVIQRSAEFLDKKGVESPRLQVELLLAHVLKLPRLGLYLNFERTLSENELAEVRELVRRRAQREPVQQITGSTSFCGLEIAVSGKVLTPRPETELLAEMGWKFLRERKKANDSPAPPAALDFGTGSGCLAIAMAVKCPGTKVAALDICEEALAVARENTARHKAQIEFYAGDGFTPLPAETRFDLIVSNPPYIPSAEIADLDPEVREHDPRRALDGGADGLDFYRRLAREAGAFLNPDGKMMLEFGDGQEAKLQKIFESEMWVVEEIKADYSGRARMLVVRR